jgi:hypothetical protein
MKVVTSILFVCVLAVNAFAINGDMGVATEPSTNGSAEYPYLIEDVNDFDAFAADSNLWASGVHTKLMCDVDLDPTLPGREIYTQAPIAGTINSMFFEGTEFSGSFDGNGHVVRNLTVDGVHFCGLFGILNPGSEVKDLGMEDVSITGSDNVGGVAGINLGSIIGCYSTGEVTGDHFAGGLTGGNSNGIITNCYSTAAVTVTRDDVGGLVGINYLGSITNSYSTGKVNGDDDVGGLVGANEDGSISSCYSTGVVSGDSSVGGLVGANSSGIITSSYSTGSVTGKSYVGGLAGGNYEGSITNSYSTGAVNGVYNVGGLVGWNYESVISSSYSVGLVTGTIGGVGGLIGANYEGSIASSFWDTQTSGLDIAYTTESGSYPDYVYVPVYGTVGVVGKTTAEMKTFSTFVGAGWDFDDVWWIDGGNDYPRLLWEMNTAPVAVVGGGVVGYAGPSGTAVVWLDGSGSYDDDGDSLSYYWFIGDELIAEGSEPNVVLSAGEYVVELFVDDGTSSSEPNSVMVTIVEAIETGGGFTPSNLNAKSKGNYVLGAIELPEGISKDDVEDGSAVLYVNGDYENSVGGEFERSIAKGNNNKIMVLFDRGALIEAAGGEIVEVVMAVRLRTGQWVFNSVQE